MYNSDDDDEVSGFCASCAAHHTCVQGAYLERAKIAYQKAKDRHDSANGQRERRGRSGSQESYRGDI
eukprot:759451-Hanusia_phi.AAC.3